MKKSTKNILLYCVCIPMTIAGFISESVLWVYSQILPEDALKQIAQEQVERIGPAYRRRWAWTSLLILLITCLGIVSYYDTGAKALNATIVSQNQVIVSLHATATAEVHANDDLRKELIVQAIAGAKAITTARSDSYSRGHNDALVCGPSSDQHPTVGSGSWVIIAPSTLGQHACTVIQFSGAQQQLGESNFIEVLPLQRSQLVTVTELSQNTVVLIGSHDKVQAEMCANRGLKDMVQSNHINRMDSNQLPDFWC